MNPGYYLLAVIGFLLSGCGTFNTVVRGDDVTAKNLKEWRTQCSSLPRVYSGAIYNFCILNGAPNPSTQAPGSPGGIPFVIWDIALSGALDTLALPYTIYRQVGDGNIELRH
ncbi:MULTISPECIES: YceK/YidQ family lipoprotein [unclassified Pseudomonas]|uniref:YceK/YidQ family lipoprotein n=1 Tax=unclassified Pseudomonas TaxID=196821 RepID=UPI0021C6444E|nr:MULTISPECIES: YceK/YidQ family lipoprotein [unclassified Pseudomonas]MCU1734385.1 YceK/YidQ family lipoprotein [Pseudomonas sp. 20P_3.2_Bac4]MCU1743410.1 YceK/YidQ family lipoprotein [Pseudomonas sp. 20P_3.2_Bac5]